MPDELCPVRQLDRLSLKMLTDCQFYHTSAGCPKYKQMNKRSGTTFRVLSHNPNGTSTDRIVSAPQRENITNTESNQSSSQNENTANEDKFNPEKNCAFRHCPASLNVIDVCTKWMKFKTCDSLTCPKRHLPQEPHYIRRVPSDLTQMCRKMDKCKNPVCCSKHPTRWINGLRFKEDDKDFKIPHKFKSTVEVSSVARATNVMSDKMNEDFFDERLTGDLMEF
jgi:hypothetical protein